MKCLFIFLFILQKPEELQDDLRAVMVWIHGGAFHMGSGSPYSYGPDFLMLQDVVVVTINYRLAVLGKQFYTIPTLRNISDQSRLKYHKNNAMNRANNSCWLTSFKHSSAQHIVLQCNKKPSSPDLEGLQSRPSS